MTTLTKRQGLSWRWQFLDVKIFNGSHQDGQEQKLMLIFECDYTAKMTFLADRFLYVDTVVIKSQEIFVFFIQKEKNWFNYDV